MSEIEWSVVAGVVALALAGLVQVVLGRLVRWRRERSREPLRAPFKLQEFSGAEQDLRIPAKEDGAAVRRPRRPSRAEEQGLAPSASPVPAASEGGETTPQDSASDQPRSAPDDLCPGNGPKGLPEDQEPAGIEAAEAQLRQLQVRLSRERARFEQLREASGDELTRALLKYGASSVADLPEPAAKKAGQHGEALQRLAEELELMERNVKRKALELVDLRRILKRSTESGWGRKLGA